MEDFGDNGFDEAGDEGVAWAFFGHFPNKVVKAVVGSLVFRVLIEAVFGVLGVGDLLPGAVVLQDRDLEVGRVVAGEFFTLAIEDVVGLEVVFAVGGGAEAIDFPWFGEVDFEPGFFGGVFGGFGSPLHGAVVSIVGVVELAAALGHFRISFESGAFRFVGKIPVIVFGSEDLEFVDEDVRVGEVDTEGFGGLFGEDVVLKAAPVFGPGKSRFAEGAAFFEELGVEFFGSFFSWVGVGEFGNAATEFDVLENGGEGVVVLDGDGVELVVVAAGARDSHADHGGPDSLHDLVHAVGAGLPDGGGFGSDGGGGDMGTGDEEAGGIARTHGVTGELLMDELVVGKVVVEGVDDVVPVDPGVFAVEVGFGAIGFSPADDIKPVLGPAFAEVRGGEEFVDEGGVGVGILLVIGDELIDAVGGGREAGEDDGSAMNEGAGIGFFVGGDFGF